ncbi:hypothetical protein B0H14DRAFT_2571001 [Mycena olivaceomarginata]|nr:hypothetical protein B0H14DRAFT_2571001 [Mycena olivaceomarginata]
MGPGETSTARDGQGTSVTADDATIIINPTIPYKQFFCRLINHVQSGGTATVPDGFAVNDEGNLARNGTIQDTKLDVVADDLPLAVRRPKRDTKVNVPVPHGGEHMWVQ